MQELLKFGAEELIAIAVNSTNWVRVTAESGSVDGVHGIEAGWTFNTDNFWPECASINNGCSADGVLKRVFIMMYIDCPRTNKVDLDCMPWRVVGLSRERQFTILLCSDGFKLLAQGHLRMNW